MRPALTPQTLQARAGRNRLCPTALCICQHFPMDPILLDIPVSVSTGRLILRCPRPGDGPRLFEMLRDTADDLKPWMPWAQAAPQLDEAEVYCRRMQARFILREDLVMFVFVREADGSEGKLVGSIGLHRIDWPARRFEIGYWRRTGCAGQGWMTEAVQALSRFAFDVLGAQRVEVRMDDSNAPSWRLAERTGFTLEALLRSDSLTPQGERRSTRIYARVRGIEEPGSDHVANAG